MNFEKDICKYTGDILSEYEFKKHNKDKILYDAVLGTQVLTPYEVNIIDSPLLQRLRYIHQTALVFFTFPSARHTRFEHSLGVSMMAQKIGNSLNLDENDIKIMKTAGLLHDIGHGPFSHTSEVMIKELNTVKKIVNTDQRFDINKPHEMISYSIIKSKPFTEHFEKICEINKQKVIDLEQVGQLIIGGLADKKNKKYLMDAINGAFDADKLDYLNRDSYFTGLKMGIDLDRIFATMMIEDRENENKGIIGKLSGVHVLEQLMFGKMLLYPSVYHHHKSCSCDCMIKGIFEFIKENNIKINGYDFDSVSDYLKITDYDLLTSEGKDPRLKRRVDNIIYRRLLKRALVISPKTIKDESNLEDLTSYADDNETLRLVAKEIADDVSKSNPCEKYDVWIELPRDPSFGAPSNYWIKVTDDDYNTLDKFFPVNKWVESYQANKWRGFVFGPAHLQEEVGKSAMKIIKEVFGLEFNRQATLLAKHSNPQ